MRIEKVAPKIYALIGKTSEEVGNVMIRLQENYESPKFRNKVFTLDKFKAWYMQNKKADTFTYFEDWAGYNVPGHIVRRFMNGKFNPLRAEEQWLVDEITRLNIKDKFYLLGFAEEDARVKKHEIAHGLFYTNRKYKTKVLAAIAQFPRDEKLHQALIDQGYCNEVLVDEYHAWTLTDYPWLRLKGIWSDDLDKLLHLLDDIYKEHT